MIASSAARSSVSVRSRFVSSNRRAFSSATPMLEPSVLRRRSSASLNACASMASRPRTPITRLAPVIGTPIHESVSVPPIEIAPAATCSSADPTRRERLVRMTADVSPSPSSRGSRWNGSPSSRSYGQEIRFVAGSCRAMKIERTSNSRRTRSPTSSMIASNSSWRDRASPTSLTTASSAARSSASASSRFVSSNSRAFSSATPMLDAIVVSRRSSASLKASCRVLSRIRIPMLRSPDLIGTPSQDSVTSPPRSRAPASISSSLVPRRSGLPEARTAEVRPVPIAIGGVWSRLPSSIS